jgi:hypothetical protein
MIATDWEEASQMCVTTPDGRENPSVRYAEKAAEKFIILSVIPGPRLLSIGAEPNPISRRNPRFIKRDMIASQMCVTTPDGRENPSVRYAEKAAEKSRLVKPKPSQSVAIISALKLAWLCFLSLFVSVLT